MSKLGNKDIAVPNVIANGKYTIEKEIGKGSFAIVYRGHLTIDINSHIAIKVVSKNKLKNKKLLENLEIEIAILKKIKHNHIVSLIDCERTQTDFYLIMEYCALGDLTFLIKKRKELIQKHPLLQEIFEFYPPPNQSHNGLHQAFILNYLQQLASALKFLRDKNLVHRDIKPQNLLLSTPLINYNDPKNFHELGYVGIYNLPILKIADFGFARFLPNSSMAETLCGSPLYMAPEILNYQKYNANADLWSVGTVLYEMCCGNPPFKASNHLELFKKIKKSNNHITFPSYFDNFNSNIINSQLIKIDELEFHEINQNLKNLINQLLTFDPKERLGFDEFFNNKLVNMDLTRFEIISTNIIETKSKDIQESNMFISEYLSTPKDTQERINTSPSNLPQERTAAGPPKNTPLKLNQRNLNTVNNSDLILEKEYVVVEKKSVEVNELADEVAQMGNKELTISTNNNNNSNNNNIGPSMNRSPSNNSNGSRRASLIERRLSINSLNPTNALSRALGIASIKLFGGTSPQQQQQTQLTKRPNSIFSTQTFNELTEKILLRINNEEDNALRTTIAPLDKITIQKLTPLEIIHILEIQAAKAFVIYSYAEVKNAQILPFIQHTTKRLSTGSCAIEDEEEEQEQDQEE
ncbi:Serine/threonine-protein kinase [Maudiozyma exigua]|uniref:Serine/threonine-protein kinase ATG1 n=1 Tax=Maudiozyma exigua TaxID=34358 RepID=A0A9P6WBV1_MAUEX|nr:Serine/threonine-protein kinase [Kazachstania exigua]